MTTAEIILAIINTLLVSGGLVVLVTLRSTVKTSKANAQGAGTDANDKLMKSYEEHILNPVLKELEALRAEREELRRARAESQENESRMEKLYEKTNRKLDRLSRAIEKIPECDYSRNHQCPVSCELRKSAMDAEGNGQD
ncbi:MAG: hypothetical protein K5683_11765 [Prevotella sp.]|jgi:hypothetical protein|nr:hypothetical protein [Prevotella sp.]